MEGVKQKLIQLINLAFEEEQVLIGKLSERERAEIGTFKQWSAKDLIAHNAFWKLNRANSIADTLKGKSSAIVGHELNKGVFEENLNRSWNDIISYMQKAHESMVASITAAAQEDLTSIQTQPWQNGKPLWKIIIIYSYLHPIGHLGRYYDNRGETFYSINLWNEASRFLEQLPATPGILGTVKYNLARFYALSGQPHMALKN